MDAIVSKAQKKSIGSRIFFVFENILITRKELRIKLVGIKSFVSRAMDSPPDRHFLEKVFIVHVSSGWKLLRSMIDRIPLREKRSLISRLKHEAISIKSESDVLLNRFFAQENRSLSSRESASLSARLRIEHVLQQAPLRKKIRKLKQTLQLLDLRGRTGSTLKSIASHLNISIGSSKRIWHKAKLNQGKVLSRMYENIIQQVLSELAVEDFLTVNEDDQLFMDSTLKANYQRFKDSNPNYSFVSLNKFYLLLRRHGYRYKSIRYSPKIARPIINLHRYLFLQFYTHLMLDRQNVRLLFFDESSVALANFKQKR